MIQRIAFAALACAVVAGPAFAAPSKPAPTRALAVPIAPPTLSFRIMGDEIIVPTPAGYCEATGAFADAAQLAAAGDNQNLTPLTLYNCAEMAAGGPAQHWAMIKVPKSMMNARATLAELLAAMGSIPDSEMQALIRDPKITDDVSKNLSQVSGAEVKVASAIAPVDRDDNGYYMAGTVNMASGQEAVGVAVAVGLTTVKGHIISFNLYGPGQTPAAIRAVLDDARAATKKLRAANP